MRQILVYGDSLTWGIIPGTRGRLPFDERWPGVMEHGLNAEGRSMRVLEDCLNGRRTVWEDPYKPGRNGLDGLAQRIETHSPLALVILDIRHERFPVDAPAYRLARRARDRRTGRRHPASADRAGDAGAARPRRRPAATPTDRKAHRPEVRRRGERKPSVLQNAYRDVCAALTCPFFDAGMVTSSSRVDGVHLDADQHLMLGTAMVDAVRPLLLA